MLLLLDGCAAAGVGDNLAASTQQKHDSKRLGSNTEEWSCKT